MNKFNIYNQRSIHFIPTVKTIFYKSFVDQKYRPDIIVFDLEDSVAPKAKDKARDTFLKFLETKDAKRILKSSCNFVAFRINNTKSKWFSSDMKLAKHPLIDIIIVPKAEDKKDIKKVRSRTKKPIGICLETIKGLLNANSFLPELSDSKGDFVIVGHEDPSSDYFIERPKNLNAINPLSYFILNAFFLVFVFYLILLLYRCFIPVLSICERYRFCICNCHEYSWCDRSSFAYCFDTTGYLLASSSRYSFALFYRGAGR